MINVDWVLTNVHLTQLAKGIRKLVLENKWYIYIYYPHAIYTLLNKNLGINIAFNAARL